MVEYVTGKLITWFSSPKVFFDGVMKVLLPDTLVLVLSKIQNISFKKALTLTLDGESFASALSVEENEDNSSLVSLTTTEKQSMSETTNATPVHCPSSPDVLIGKDGIDFDSPIVVSKGIEPKTNRIKSKDEERKRKKRKAEEEIEDLRKRLRRAERAAEKEFMDVSSEKEICHEEAEGEERVKNDLKYKEKKLKEKRKRERLRKKVRANLELYLPSHDTVKPSHVKKKRKFEMKCIECGEVMKSDSLAGHLVTIHKYSSDTARMKESELRVMFLWASKEKHGSEKPLPCVICNKWHMRLRNHLRYKHKDLQNEDINKIVESARKEYWCTAKLAETAKKGGVKHLEPENDEISKRSKDRFQANLYKGPAASYAPKNSFILTEFDRQLWNLKEKDFFNFYYKDQAFLMKAFEEDLVANGSSERQAKQHCQYVEYIWDIVDPSRTMFPLHAFSNPICIEDNYHRLSLELVGKGGVEANTLRTRFSSLRHFLKFLRRRHIYAGLTREHFRLLEESIEDWNIRLRPLIKQRKVNLRRLKTRHLLTVEHMIKYGRSPFTQDIVAKLNNYSTRGKSKYTIGFCLKVRDYVMTNICIMNGLRASNLIELLVSDVKEASRHDDYPGHWVIINSNYKTSTIYGEKVIAIPDAIFNHLKIYMDHLRPLFENASSKYLFLPSSNEDKMSHGVVGSALTSSFKDAEVFSEKEYQRVCPTRIRCACATFACNLEGMDIGFFAKNFMKNKEETTQRHYNLHSNVKHALSLAMMVGDGFQVGGERITIKQSEREDLTNLLLKKSRPSELPSKEKVLEWIKLRNSDLTAMEMNAIDQILEELSDPSTISAEKTASSFYGDCLENENDGNVEDGGGIGDDEVRKVSVINFLGLVENGNLKEVNKL
ncbi:uncharacterized protein LOC130624937 isoform X1 [Hydractinia symbiolongicarpus]|uniref:uncharacterized protein LOC130624937 isoform X1 n=1 Tax=Hydractinia symbiolongicarpus TaxID=13093 RepID=UPI0025509A5C|nr:uncharacterized protein LOC130624937 isoform X1 [Hydractinia symbiolongicarpus]